MNYNEYKYIDYMSKTHSILIHFLPVAYSLKYSSATGRIADERMKNLLSAVDAGNTQHLLELLLEYNMLTLKQIANNITIQIEEFST